MLQIVQCCMACCEPDTHPAPYMGENTQFYTFTLVVYMTCCKPDIALADAVVCVRGLIEY